MSHSMAILYFYLPYFQVSKSVLFFAKYSGTLILYRRNHHTFYNDSIVLKFDWFDLCFDLCPILFLTVCLFHILPSHYRMIIFNEICILKYTRISRQFHRIKSQSSPQCHMRKSFTNDLHLCNNTLKSYKNPVWLYHVSLLWLLASSTGRYKILHWTRLSHDATGIYLIKWSS